MNCEKCGGPAWDNRTTKKNPRQPDFKCKNKDGCGWVKWLKDDEKTALYNGASANNNGTSGVKRPSPVLDKLFNECLKAAQSISAGAFRGIDASDLEVRMATTLFIARVDGKGILTVEKEILEKLAAVKAEQEATEREERARREQQQMSRQINDEPYAHAYNESDLPF